MIKSAVLLPAVKRSSNGMKVAIVHDWFVGGGAELVVEQIHKMYPNAPIYTSYCTDEWRQRLDNRVITGYLQHWPFSKLRKFLPLLRQRWFSNLDMSSYDLVISSSGNGEAKFVTVAKPAIHISYCHSPTHFYWRHYDYYMQVPGFGPQTLVRLGLKLLLKPLRQRDYNAAQQVDAFIANSTHIRSDIKTFYNRDSVVIYPPVDVEIFQKAKHGKRQGFITVGRQVPYKRVDIIVDACTKLNLPLTVIGRGPEHKKLVQRAGRSVKFITNASQSDVATHLPIAKAFILAAFEDFGITPVEALAAGTPVIAYHAGGALDYVNKTTGVFFNKQTSENLVSAMAEFGKLSFDHERITQEAHRFSLAKFRFALSHFLKEISRTG